MTNKEKILLHEQALEICNAIAENRTRRKELEEDSLTAEYNNEIPAYLKKFLIELNKQKISTLDKQRMKMHIDYALLISKIISNEYNSATN